MQRDLQMLEVGEGFGAGELHHQGDLRAVEAKFSQAVRGAFAGFHPRQATGDLVLSQIGQEIDGKRICIA